MENNFEKYKKDLDKLIEEGNNLYYSILYEHNPEEFKVQIYEKESSREEADIFLNSLPRFFESYQLWYTESLVLLKKVLPDRVDDFIKLYSVNNNSFSIKVPNISRFQQQLGIIKSVERRFESSLFDIKKLLQGELFYNELDASKELQKKGFLRAAGTIAGVVLEKHLKEVVDSHEIKIKKKNPTIGDLNGILKENDIIEIDKFRNIQLLGDLRNKCTHNKDEDPTSEDIDDLIKGTDKIIKTVF